MTFPRDQDKATTCLRTPRVRFEPNLVMPLSQYTASHDIIWHIFASYIDGMPQQVSAPSDVPPRPQPLSGTPPKPLGPGWSTHCIRDLAPCITTGPVSSRNEILQLRRDYTWVHDHFLQMMMKRRVLSSEYNQGTSSEHSVTADFRHHLPAQPQH